MFDSRFWRLARHLWPYKIHVLLIMLSGFFFGAVNSCLAGLAGFAINVVGWSPAKGPVASVLPGFVRNNASCARWLQEHQTLLTQHNLFLLVLGLLFLLMVGLSLSIFFQNFLPELLSNRITVDMRNRLGAHLLSMDFAFFKGTRSGELYSRLSNDLGQLSAGMMQLGVIFTRPFTLIVLTLFLFSSNWTLAIYGLIGAPIAGVILAFLFKRIRRIARQVQAQAATLTDTMMQFLTGISTVKAYGCEKFELENFRKANEAFFRVIIRCVIANNAERPVTSLTGKLGVLLVLYFGGIMVMDGSLPVDNLATFLATLAFMYSPSKELTRAQSNLHMHLAGVERVFDVLETDAKIVEGTTELTSFRSGIAFQSVSFHYVADTPVLKGVSFTVKKGETLALVGPSGSGKSTLVHLLLRLYDVTDGAIRIDDVDIRELTFSSLRGRVALVSQNPFLFNSSIRDNIAYGRADAREEDIIRAAQVANIHEDILKLTNGYDTLVGDRGENLSGGQRQRVAIARAVFKDPEILLLDEATSALDSENERKVQDALEALQRNRTSIVIAHRLSTIRNATRIAMIENGALSGIGGHQELLESCPGYANLVRLQQW